jgi:probable rRNA maturation factor
MPITFHNENISFKLNKKLKIKQWMKLVIEKEKKATGNIQFIFTNDEQQLQRNIQFLNHQALTDIITFDYCDVDIIHGDIFISIERVEENAENFKAQFIDELLRVMAHGVLHLCGYKDKTKEQITLMRSKEDVALRLFSK